MNTSTTQHILNFFQQNPNHTPSFEDATEITNTLFSDLQDLDFITTDQIQTLQILTQSLTIIKNK